MTLPAAAAPPAAPPAEQPPAEQPPAEEPPASGGSLPATGLGIALPVLALTLLGTAGWAFRRRRTA